MDQPAYESQFKVVRLVYWALLASIVVMAVAGFLVNSRNTIAGQTALDPASETLLEVVFSALVGVLVLVSMGFRSAIRSRRPAALVRVIEAATRNLHRQSQGNSAVSLLLPALAMLEAVGVLGFVFFILTGNIVVGAVLLGVALLALVLSPPTAADRDGLISIDREQRAGGEGA